MEMGLKPCQNDIPPELILAPNSGSFENKKIQVAKWSTPKNIFF